MYNVIKVNNIGEIKMKRLSDSEFEIMKVLWRMNKPLTSNEISKELRDCRNWKLASLMTVLARMAEKGYVFCDRSTRTNYYSAVITEEKYKIEESESFLQKMYDKSLKQFVACMYQGKRLSVQDVDELRKYLDSLKEDN